MKCLTVRQPWAYLIIAGIKRIENRSRATKFRGRLAIHAAQKLDGDWNDILDAEGGPVGLDEEVEVQGGTVLPPVSSLPLGAIVGTVEVTDCVPYDALPPDLKDGPFASGPFCWLLAE